MPDFKHIKSGFPDVIWDGTSETRNNPADMRDPNGFDRAKAVVELIALQEAVQDLLEG